jgi:hypothetical protein
MKDAPQFRLGETTCDLFGHLHGSPGTIPAIVDE